MPGVIFHGQSGCLLPMLIFFNLIFGRVIFKSVYIWLGIELVLVGVFIFKTYSAINALRRHISPGGGAAAEKEANVVDIEGSVVDEQDGNK
ncbi:MAG: hypothetical protein WC572_03930 [Candidatus Omnitrophota bacterium]